MVPSIQELVMYKTYYFKNSTKEMVHAIIK